MCRMIKSSGKFNFTFMDFDYFFLRSRNSFLLAWRGSKDFTRHAELIIGYSIMFTNNRNKIRSLGYWRN